MDLQRPTGPAELLGLALIAIAGMLALIGFALLVGGRIGLGSLPGDIRLRGENWGCYVPITTSILLSLVLSLLLTLLSRLGK